ncbi:hypothetical protein [Chryseobacterium polytrichastri]|uniref:Uncharacterized protein n=1 Tax=Chryseobacterium polytrichastri TaxID=1302687 RepID=A0A1M6QVX9_9FLAO|nr:hypothetical protein [Chryseobacterium polytrichastri]SHK24217.1 hypothetical protein SAMN05444267_1002106 [Chryseobacterium polytrichastri]
MSRIRIVKGKYVKITHGDHNMSTEGHIVSNAAGEIREKGNENGIIYNNFERKGSEVNDDFEIKLSLKRDKAYSTVVPFGILDFKGNYENAHFVFDYSLMLGNIDSLDFKILNEDGSTLYAVKNLPEVVVPSRQIPLLAQDLMKKKPKNDPLQPKKAWDWKSVFDPYNIMSGDYTKIGSYVIFWDGFDNNEIYDSTKFDNKKLKAVIVAKKNGKEKTKEVEFTTNYSEVNWVDVKIDKKNKRIDTTLRVNLKDGGEEGLGQHVGPVSSTYPAKEYEIKYDWEKVPKKVISKWGKEPIKYRTRTYKDLEKLSIEGLNYHWGRNQNHAVAKDLKIIRESYEFYLNSIQSNKNTIGTIELVYNTNGNWMRSGNPGSIKDPLTIGGNIFSRQAICYNIGYIYSLEWYEFYKKNNWRYRDESNEDIEFKETSAHEIGHEIIKKYGGTIYSYGHKETVNPVFQYENSNAIPYPKTGEIDLMPYYTDWLDYSERKRIVVSEKDVLGLIWLTKISIK